MPKRKDWKYMTVCLDKSLLAEFDKFCKDHSMTKTGATEQALRQYMDTMNKALESVKNR